MPLTAFRYLVADSRENLQKKKKEEKRKQEIARKKGRREKEHLYGISIRDEVH